MNERAEIRKAILELLKNRSPGKTICPSEAARTVYEVGSWRAKMPLIRCVSTELATAGEIEICQKGKVVAPSLARGPIRLRLLRGDSS